MHLSRIEMAEIYKFNNERREALVNAANKLETPEEKLKFVVDYFLNNLPIETIAEIDGVPANKVIPFEYDYSFLQGGKDQFTRESKFREYAPGKYAPSISHADNDVRVHPAIPIYPSIYTSKMGTCIMFARELQRFAIDFGIEVKFVEKFTPCYDYYVGKTSEGQKVETDRLINMFHFFNVAVIGGKEYKIDIAGGLTALDFNNKHPEHKIDQNAFYFSTDIDSNPFEKSTFGRNFILPENTGSTPPSGPS